MTRNVFEDLGFEDKAAGMQLKSYLLMALQEAIRVSGLTQKEVAEYIGCDQPKISKIMTGKIDKFSFERLADFLYRMGYDIELTIVPIEDDDDDGEEEFLLPVGATKKKKKKKKQLAHA